MGEKIPAKFIAMEDKTAISQEKEENVAISQEKEENQKKSSQEIAETEEMKMIADEKADDQKTEKTEEKTISPGDAANIPEKRKMIAKRKAPMEERRPDRENRLRYFNWEQRGIFSCHEQQLQLLCWCYAITDYLQARFFQKWGMRIKLSKQELIDNFGCAKDFGKSYPYPILPAFLWIQRNGIGLEENYKRFSGTKGTPSAKTYPRVIISPVQSESYEENIVVSKLSQQPLLAFIEINSEEVYQCNRNRKPYAVTGETNAIGHAVLLTGWSELPSKCYLVRDPDKLIRKIKRANFDKNERSAISEFFYINDISMVYDYG